MPHVIGVIQARMGSTRLPGKIVAPLAGLPLLDRLVTRVRPASVARWWVATTTDAQDDATEEHARRLDLEVFRGDVDDVLSRFAAIVDRERPAWVVRVTADDPFVDAEVVERLVATAGATPDAVHVEEAPPRRLPLGYVPEVVRGSAVEALAAEPLPAHHRAHVTSALRERGVTTPWTPPPDWPSRSGWRWTVDTPEDLAMADAAFGAMGAEAPTMGYPAIVELLDARPDITGANADVRQRSVDEG